jgi:hypothetical protein
MSNVIDFTHGHRNLGSENRQARPNRRPFGQDKQLRRRDLVDQIRKRMEEQPKMRGLWDRQKVAENLAGVLETASATHGVKIAHILEAAGQGPSTKQYGRFALKPELPTDEKEGRASRLSPSIAVYRRIAQEAAKLSGQDEDALLIDLVRGSSYDPESSNVPAANIPDWAFVLSEMLTAMATSVVKNSKLEWYFSQIEHYSLWLRRDKGSNDPENLNFETDEESCYERIEDLILRLSQKETGVFASRDEYVSFFLFPYVWIGDIACKPTDVEIAVERKFRNETTGDEVIRIINKHGSSDVNSPFDNEFTISGSLLTYRQLFILLAPYGPSRKILPLFATFPQADLTVSRKHVVLGDDDQSARPENEQGEPPPSGHSEKPNEGIDSFELDDVPFPPVGSQNGKTKSHAAHQSFSTEWVALKTKQSNCGAQARYRVNGEATLPPDFHEGFTFEEVTPGSCSRLLGEDWVYDSYGLKDATWGETTTMSLAPYRTLASLIERNLYFASNDNRLDHLLIESSRECCKRLEDWTAQATAIIEERHAALRSEWTGGDSD